MLAARIGKSLLARGTRPKDIPYQPTLLAVSSDVSALVPRVPRRVEVVRGPKPTVERDPIWKAVRVPRTA